MGYDFVKNLMKKHDELTILGDGTQSKSYIYIDDIINAIRTVEKKFLENFNYYNVATLDYITVSEIADIVSEIMGLKNVNQLNKHKLLFVDKDSRVHDNIDEVFKRQLDLGKDMEDDYHEFR